MSGKQLYAECSTNMVLESPPPQILTPAASYQEGRQKYRRDRFEEETPVCNENERGFLCVNVSYSRPARTEQS